MARIGFIGMGNMGFAIMSALIAAGHRDDMVFSCRRAAHGQEVAEKTGVSFEPSNRKVAEISDIIVLAVKPVVYPEVLGEICGTAAAPKIIISLAPGISIASLSEKLGGNGRIVRAMPNTPALVREGMTGIAYDEKEFNEEEIRTVSSLFGSFGRMKKVPERLMDAVTTVSGSSPAFVYLFIDALADAGVRCGLTKADALEMAAQTVYGSAKMVLEGGEHPAVLKDRVCSPGGTTIEGVAALEKEGFRNAVLEGCAAVYRKCGGK